MIYLNDNVSDIMWNGKMCIAVYLGDNLVWTSKQKEIQSSIAIMFTKTTIGWSAMATQIATNSHISCDVNAVANIDAIKDITSNKTMSFISLASPYARPDKLPKIELSTNTYINSNSVSASSISAEHSMDLSPDIIGDGKSALAVSSNIKKNIFDSIVGMSHSVPLVLSTSDYRLSGVYDAIGSPNHATNINAAENIKLIHMIHGLSKQGKPICSNNQMQITTFANPFSRIADWTDPVQVDDVVNISQATTVLYDEDTKTLEVV